MHVAHDPAQQAVFCHGQADRDYLLLNGNAHLSDEEDEVPCRQNCCSTPGTGIVVSGYSLFAKYRFPRKGTMFSVSDVPLGCELTRSPVVRAVSKR